MRQTPKDIFATFCAFVKIMIQRHCRKALDNPLVRSDFAIAGRRSSVSTSFVYMMYAQTPLGYISYLQYLHRI